MAAAEGWLELGNAPEAWDEVKDLPRAQSDLPEVQALFLRIRAESGRAVNRLYAEIIAS